MAPIRCCKELEVWITNWSCLHLHVHPVFHVSCLKKVIGDKISIQTIYQRLMKKGKSYQNQKKSLKQGLSSCKIKKLLSTSSNGRTYQWKRLHCKMSSSCRNTHGQSSVEDKTCLKGRGMLSPIKIPMLTIKPLIKPQILNYYISSVIFVCRLEPFIVPFHYNCTYCPLRCSWLGNYAKEPIFHSNF